MKNREENKRAARNNEMKQLTQTKLCSDKLPITAAHCQPTRTVNLGDLIWPTGEKMSSMADD